MKAILFTLEKEYYSAALERVNVNKAQAVQLLDIEPAAFRKALRKRFAG